MYLIPSKYTTRITNTDTDTDTDTFYLTLIYCQTSDFWVFLLFFLWIIFFKPTGHNLDKDYRCLQDTLLIY